MNTQKLILISFGCATVLASCNNSKGDIDMNDKDRDFMKQAAYGNLAEVKAGQLASSKAMDNDVKMFGDMMVKDHQKAYDELKSLSSDMDMDIPDAPDQDHQNTYEHLQGLSGKKFDSEYVQAQLSDHKKTVTLFESETNNGQNQRVKDYANKYLPTLRKHLSMIDSINNNMGDSLNDTTANRNNNYNNNGSGNMRNGNMNNTTTRNSTSTHYNTTTTQNNSTTRNTTTGNNNNMR